MDNVIHIATIKHLYKEKHSEIIQVNQNEIVKNKKKNYENPQENRKSKNKEMKNKENKPKK